MGNKYWIKLYHDSEVVARNVLIDYLGGEFVYCCSKEDLQLHHKTMRVFGGKDSMSNIELVCFKCHVELHKQIRLINPIKSRKSGKLESVMKNLGYISCEESKNE